MGGRSKDGRKKGTWVEFDCPVCSAHNPWDDGFTWGDELFCSWCGAVLLVKRSGDELEESYRLVQD